MNAILFTITEQIKNILVFLLNPIIPNSTNKVLDTINISIKIFLLKILKMIIF